MEAVAMRTATLVKFNEGETLNHDDIKAYFLLNEESKKIKNELDALKDRIKNAMIQNDLDTLQAGEYVVQMINKTSRTLDEDMLAQLLVSKGIHKETTEVKIVPVKEKVIAAIGDGKLQQAEYDLCLNVSYSSAMTVKKTK